MILPIQLQSSYEYIETINLKELGIRKNISVFVTNLKKEKCIVFYITQKSRFLQKDADKIEEIYHIISNVQNEFIQKKIILIESPLCSKAKLKLESFSWEIIK